MADEGTYTKLAAIAGVAGVYVAVAIGLHWWPFSSDSPQSPPSTAPTTTDTTDTTLISTPTSAAPTSPQVLKSGDALLEDGQQLNLETGEVGRPPTRPDISWGSSIGQLASANGEIVTAGHGGANPKSCRERLDDSTVVAGDVDGLWYHLGWYCTVTSDRHLAAIQAVSIDKDVLRMHYLVWNVQR